jgi:hypothetical protein
MDQNQRREYLFQRDLEMEKQMEKIIKDAQPKPKPDMTLKLLKPIKINTDLLTGTPEYQAQKQLSDLELDQQINNTIKQAIRTAENKAPEKYTNAVSQEMIDEYRKEVMKPIDIKGKKFLYRSVEVPPIAKPIDTPFYGIERTENEVLNLIDDLTDEIGDLEDEYDNNTVIKRRLEDAYTRTTTAPAYDEAKRRAELSGYTKGELVGLVAFMGLVFSKNKNKAEQINKIVDSELRERGRSPVDIRAQIDQIELDIQQIVLDITTKKDEIKKIESNYNLQLRVEEENRLKNVEYENLQRQQNDELLNDFNRLNMGRTQLFRESDETEEEFYNRLVAMGNVEADPADIEKQIQTDILLKAKKNILELTNDESKAETVIKMLNTDERFQMNKFFPKIKKTYSDTFGINNKDMDADEISQFIQNQLVSGQSLVSPPESDEKDSISYKIRRWKLKKVGLLIDALNDDNDLLNLTRGTVKDMVDDLDSKNIYKAPEFLDIYNKISKIDPNLIADVRPDPLAGKGLELKNQVLPQTVIFGKIALDLNKLFYQNVLSIKRHNGNKIIGHKNKRVSDNFVELVFKMFDNKPITQSDLKNIKDEQMIYDNLIVQSGLHKSNQIPTTIEQTSEQMKNRLGLITGEIEAGNSNKSLLTELHELLFKMVRVHLISKTAASAYYKNLKDQYFTI